MGTESLLLISNLLKINNIGFAKLLFQSNLGVDELYEWENSNISLKLNLFCENNKPFTLVLNWKDFDDIECAENDEFENSICIMSGIKSYNSQKMLEIKLFFPGSYFNCGECYIFEYDKTEELDEKPIESYNGKNFQPSQFENENSKMERIRRRNLLFVIFAIIIIIIAGCYYVVKNPEISKQVINFFRF